VIAGRRIEIRGTVQGVGFRPWVVRLARELGVAGRVRNDAGGVTVEAFGAEGVLESFTRRLRREPPAGADVSDLVWQPLRAEAPAEFAVAPSEQAAERRVAIPPDLAICEACLAELGDPRDRRFGYPFVNCTHCGPRFTIALDVPYDRAATTMAPFRMCERCAREYGEPADRRFHAQPNACPTCGPRLRAEDPAGGAVPGDPIAAAAAALAAGRIVAVKGLGGFHLACDATSEAAVALLRARKRRDAKPFAVMARTLAEAERIAWLGADERRLLASPAAPIVLARRRSGARLAGGVAPESPLVGLLLAYTPLHHLLCAAAGRPLVMTSANLAGEPIACREEDVRARLAGVPDVVLTHDRAIVGPCEDSVARVIGGAPVVMRRSRGWVPRPVPLARPVRRPVLGCGGDFKNAVCLAVGALAYPGPHVGDLDAVEAGEALLESARRLERLVGVRAEVVAHDLHPAFRSAALARGLPAAHHVGVQHHHAHVASAMAEHGLLGPVLGVAYDGTGWGPDGTAWGGEVLLADLDGFERVATWRPVALPGGERAIREVWRAALAALDDAFAGEPPLGALALFAGVAAPRLAAIRRLCDADVACPRARGVGRWFDVFGALGLAMQESRFEGEVATAWSNVADPAARGAYPVAIDFGRAPWEIDPRPALRAAVDDVRRGDGAPAIAARFHRGVVRATIDVVRAAAGRHGRPPVVLTGGCFQNPWLAEGVAEGLAPGFAVHRHRDVPPGDGGIALGQVLVADARTRACA
jgi:hydrogenase maturation protein HypF